MNSEFAADQNEVSEGRALLNQVTAKNKSAPRIKQSEALKRARIECDALHEKEIELFGGMFAAKNCTIHVTVHKQ